jgi:perosamine synthetase
VTLPFIALAQPDLGGNEGRYVQECIATSWISSHGRFISEFEAAAAELAGTKHAIATNNGTTALHLALVALGVGPGDEIIVPTVTYVATANAVIYCGATPVLVDVEPGTLNISLEDVARKITPKTRGVIPVHLYGVPANVSGLRELCDAEGLFMLEDAAEAHGATLDGRKVGSFGEAAIFSFFGNKIVTTGEGGAVTTNDDDLATKLRLYRGQGMDPAQRYWFPVVGYNYRMTNIQAAIGLAQLERFDEFISARAAIATRYLENFTAIGDEIELTSVPANASPVPWLQNVFLRDADAPRRAAMMGYLTEQHVDSRPVFYPMHVLPVFETDTPFPVADDWSARGISLPLHTALSVDDVDRVCDALVSGLRTI